MSVLQQISAAIAQAVRTVLQTTWKLVKIGGKATLVATTAATSLPGAFLGSIFGGGGRAEAAQAEAAAAQQALAQQQAQEQAKEQRELTLAGLAKLVHRAARVRAQDGDLSPFEARMPERFMRHMISLSTDEAHRIAAQPHDTLCAYLMGQARIEGCRSVREVEAEADRAVTLVENPSPSSAAAEVPEVAKEEDKVLTGLAARLKERGYAKATKSRANDNQGPSASYG